MTMKRGVSELKGSIVPLVTPFAADGDIDEAKLMELIEWHMECGSHGISVTGTTGEPSSLSLDERERVMEVDSKVV
jgi:4-hydroxy-tetrahydrodipicolinate synthase